MKVQIDTLSQIAADNIVFLHWSEFADAFYVLRASGRDIAIEQRDAQTFGTLSVLTLHFDQPVSVNDFKDYPQHGFFGICLRDRVQIYGFDGRKRHDYFRGDGIRGFQARDAYTILLKQSEFSGCLSLGVWDLLGNTVQTFELASIGPYNWSYKINSDGTLLYGTFNAYECGTCLHVLDFSKDQLEVISSNEAYSHRDEINCYALGLNSIGDEYVYIADDDTANYTLCHKSIYQRKALNTLKLPKGEAFLRTRFVCDRFVLARTAKSILLFDPWDRSYKPGKEYGHKFATDEKTPSAVDNLSGRILFLHKGKLQLARVLETAQEIDDERQNRMQRFEADAFGGKFEVALAADFYPTDWDE